MSKGNFEREMDARAKKSQVRRDPHTNKTIKTQPGTRSDQPRDSEYDQCEIPSNILGSNVEDHTHSGSMVEEEEIQIQEPHEAGGYT